MTVKNSFTPVNDSLTAGEQIREYRMNLGLSQERVAARAGISLGLLSEIERGIAPNGNFLGCVQEVLMSAAVEQISVAAGVLRKGLKRHAA